jgi:hypothetical protein
MKTKTHFAFRVDTWDDTGDSIVGSCSTMSVTATSTASPRMTEAPAL